MYYPKYIIEILKENYSDEEIRCMSKDEVFDALLEYEGILGYGTRIRGWLKDIYQQENFYFTFGSWEKFPYQNTYLVVRATNIHEAAQKYRNKYPDITPNVLNCSFVYDESRWRDLNMQQHYNEPAEIIE